MRRARRWLFTRTLRLVIWWLDRHGLGAVNLREYDNALSDQAKLARYVHKSGALRECWSRRPRAIDRLNMLAQSAHGSVLAARTRARQSAWGGLGFHIDA